MIEPDRIPVIAAIGEVTDRKGGKAPRALIVEAVEAAMAQAPGLRSLVDEMDVISVASFRYQDIARLVADDLGIRPARLEETTVGGELPIRLLGEIAERVAAGDIRAAVLCGGEAAQTRAQIAKRGETPDWGPADPEARPSTPLKYVTPQAASHGLTWPVNVYPLYENATRHAWEQSLDDAQQESARLWQQYSAVAAHNPNAWINREMPTEAIAADTPDNRMIAFPYRKLMVANPMVNQSSAIIVTTLAAALAAGIPETDLVYIGSGARAVEPKDFLKRDRYDRSAVQDEVLERTLAANDIRADGIDLWELYSCFPTVPKMARRTLGLGADVMPSVAGGLTFFGGPANNYMTHAIVAAVRRLRTGQGRNAFLYGQGEYVTKHAAILLARRAGITPVMQDVQADADARMDPIPNLLATYEGQARIESFTIIYDRNGAPIQAPIIARTPDGARTVALGLLDGTGLAAWLASEGPHPIGASGTIKAGPDGTLHFIRA